jgi:hypothetical protein
MVYVVGGKTPTTASDGCGSFHYEISEDQQRRKIIKALN